RADLWSVANLENSIPNNGSCEPAADFYANRLNACKGEQIAFKNFSWKLSGNNPAYTWAFEDGTTSDLNAENPTVTFNSPGWKNVTLSVDDNGTTNTIVK